MRGAFGAENANAYMGGDRPGSRREKLGLVASAGHSVAEAEAEAKDCK
jgi:hypothetical protein